MLETEGPENVLLGHATLEEGTENCYNLTRYKENLPLYGIYAIGVRPK